MSSLNPLHSQGLHLHPTTHVAAWALCLQRIQAFDQRLHLNSVRALAPNVRQAAAVLDKVLEDTLANASASDPPAEPQLPPLFCVPILVKDNYNVVGLATTAGQPHGAG